jgi:hypothetical protein
MKNIEYIKSELHQNIKLATKQIDKLYKEVHNIEKKYPNDCTGYICDDGQISENPNLKIDILTNYYHQIGYFECMKFQSKNILSILNMNNEKLDNMIKNNIKIEKENKKIMNDILKYIKLKK